MPKLSARANQMLIGASILKHEPGTEFAFSWTLILQTYYKDILFLILRLHFPLMQYPNRLLLQNSSASFQVV